MNRPGTVNAAFWITVIQVIVSVVFSALVLTSGFLLLGNAALSAGAVYAAQIGGAIVTFVIAVVMLVIAFAMRRGRNWARIVLIVLAGLGAVFSLLGLFGGGDGVSITSGVLTVVLNVIIVILLASKSASAYFAAAKR